jgi:tetratricopeptide (TPR) repeat protein
MRRAAFACLLAVVAAPFVVTHARADQGKHPSPAAVKAAAHHFERAKELYQAGNYDDAISELETARALDPYAKDLVYNLGLVHEKAGHIENALHFYKLYLEMDLEPSERARAESIVHRLEGARVHEQPTTTATATATAPPTGTYVPPPPPPAHGRVDGLTVISAVLALGGFGVGTGFGLAALGARPASGLVTGDAPPANLTFQELQAQTDHAHTLAIAADIGFLAGLAFTGLTLGLFFGRTKTTDTAHRPAVSFAPSNGGGSVVFWGSF